MSPMTEAQPRLDDSPPALPGAAWIEHAKLAGDVTRVLLVHVLVRRGGGALRRLGLALPN